MPDRNLNASPAADGGRAPARPEGVRYVAAARRLYLAEHTVEGDATATRCGLDLLDAAELWQDVPAEQVARPCPECAGTTTQEALTLGGGACG